MTTKTKSGTDEQNPGVETPELGAWQRLKARLERRRKRDEVLVAHADRVLAGKPALWPLEKSDITPAFVSAALEAGLEAGTVEYGGDDLTLICYAEPAPDGLSKLEDEYMGASQKSRDADWEERKSKLGPKRRACVEAAERIVRDAGLWWHEARDAAGRKRGTWLEGHTVFGPLPTTPHRVYEVAWWTACQQHDFDMEQTRHYAIHYAIAKRAEEAMKQAGIAPPQTVMERSRGYIAGMVKEAIERGESIDPDARSWCEYDRRAAESEQRSAEHERWMAEHERKMAELRRETRRLKVSNNLASAADAIAEEAGAAGWMVDDCDDDVTPDDDYVLVRAEPDTLPALYDLARAAARFRIGGPVVDVRDAWESERWAHEALERHGVTVPGGITAAAKERIRIAAEEAAARGVDIDAKILEWCKSADPIDGGA